jgi:hypothetical protein
MLVVTQNESNEYESRSRRGVLDTTLSNKHFQQLFCYIYMSKCDSRHKHIKLTCSCHDTAEKSLR